MKYTQREWDRVVGYGKVPEQYRHVSDRKTDGQDSTRGNKTIIESTTDRVRCSGENKDHPLVYYTRGEKGFVVCGYCDLVFVRKENP